MIYFTKYFLSGRIRKIYRSLSEIMRSYGNLILKLSYHKISFNKLPSAILYFFDNAKVSLAIFHAIQKYKNIDIFGIYFGICIMIQW